MRTSWSSLVVCLHFLLIFQDSYGQRIFSNPGISTVLQPPGQISTRQSTGNTLENILQASFEPQQNINPVKSTRSKAQFSSYSPPSQEYNSPPIVGSAYGVPDNTFGFPGNTNGASSFNNQGSVKARVSSFQVINITMQPLGMLNLPFGERSTFAFTFPPSDENLFNKPITNSYGSYAPYDAFVDELSTNEVRFTKEPTINIGSIVSDAFVLKERIDIPSGNQTGSKPSGASVINNIINNVFAQNTARISNVQNETNIHSPGDLIAREIPFNGTIDYTSLNNLTEFLIKETSKPRAMSRLQLARQTVQAPMFVSLQFNTLGRQMMRLFKRSYHQETEKKARIHVVLGNKHFEFKSIEELSQLNAEIQHAPTFSSSNDFNSNGAPIFSQTTVYLIKEFVNFSWEVHQDIFKNAELRSKDISDRLIELIKETSTNTTRFQPNRPFAEEPPLDFVTWPHVVTLAFRTLLV